MTTLLLKFRALPRAASIDRVWVAVAAILLVTTALAPLQAGASLSFTLQSLWQTAPYLALSVAAAAWTRASGADHLVARAFRGRAVAMIVTAAAFGGLSPLCSCGVIPLIAALLGMGVPLAPVMAFWLASPVIDPSMFILTAGLLGHGFALAKTAAAIGLGIAGGFVTLWLTGAGRLGDPLRDGVGAPGCEAQPLHGPQPVAWAFWRDPGRRARFAREARAVTAFLGKWLTLAFVLESLMLAWIPAATVAALLGGDGLSPILTATLVGVPAYLNGYAALPLVAGLIQQGMAPGAGLAFLVAGGVTSMPAAIAVFALVRTRVFVLYLVLALLGSFATGALYQQWLALGG